MGVEAQRYRQFLDLRYPIERGLIVDFNSLEALYQHIFQEELMVSPEAAPVLITEPVLNEKMAREKLCQLMFEVLPFFLPQFFL